MTKTFEMNGKAYATDADTLNLLRKIVSDGKAANDMSAVSFMMEAGKLGGRIKELGAA